MALGTTKKEDNRFKLKSVLVPEGQEQAALSNIVTPKFSPEQKQQFGQEFSDENISKISERLQQASAPRFQREQARLSNLLTSTGSLQGTPLAVSRSLLAGEQQSQIAQQEADLLRRQAEQQAIDRRSAEQRQFTVAREDIARDFTLGRDEDQRAFQEDLVNLQRTFDVEDREFDTNLRKLNAQFQLVKSGQLTGTEADRVLQEAGIVNPQDFLSDDDIALEREAVAQGISVSDLLEARQEVGKVLLADMIQNPERYAGLAVDPEEEFRRQKELAEAQAPDDGGKVLCTELHRQGLLDSKIYKADAEYAELIPNHVVIGYHAWGIPLAKLMKKSRFVTWLVKPFVKAWAYHMGYLMGVTEYTNRLGMFLEYVGIPICGFIGNLKIGFKKRREA